MADETASGNGPAPSEAVPVPLPVPDRPADKPGKHPLFEHAEGIGKLTTVVLGILYVLGLLVSNIQLMELGISDFGSLQPRNVLTGFFFVFYTMFLTFALIPVIIWYGAMMRIMRIIRISNAGWRIILFFLAITTVPGLIIVGAITLGEGILLGYLYPWGRPFGSENWGNALYQYIATFYHRKVGWASYIIFFLLLPLGLILRIEQKPQLEPSEGGDGGHEKEKVRRVKGEQSELEIKDFHLVWRMPKWETFRVFLIGAGALFLFGGLPFLLFHYADEVYPNFKFNLGGGQPQVAEIVLSGKKSDLAEAAAAWAPTTILCCEDKDPEQTIKTSEVAIWYQSDKFIYASSLRNVPGTAQIVAVDLKLVRNIRYQPKYVQVESGARIARIHRRGEAFEVKLVLPWQIPPPPAPTVWAQLLPDEPHKKEKLIARAVVAPGAACPTATFTPHDPAKGASSPMEERWSAADGPFPIKICEIEYSGSVRARIGDTTLKRRPTDPQKIVVIGDTGCRIASWGTQACNDPDEWPFGKIAARIVALDPDLVIHVGDYQYREECPLKSVGKCADVALGDVWPAWEDDFFEPAGALLAAAPWVMLRGNHEDMSRAGAGFQLLLSPFPHEPAEVPWPDDGRPYALRFDHLTLAILDVANEGMAGAAQLHRERYVRWVERLTREVPADPARQSWLFLHKPVFVSTACHKPKPEAGNAPECKEEIAEAKKDEPMNVLRSRLNTDPRPPFDAIFGGDTHMFQFFAPDGHGAPQIVAGMSGTLLEQTKDFDDAVLGKPVKAKLFGTDGRVWMHRGFGYLVLTKDNAGAWSAALHDPDGNLVVTCNPAAASPDRIQSDSPCR